MMITLTCSSSTTISKSLAGGDRDELQIKDQVLPYIDAVVLKQYGTIVIIKIVLLDDLFNH